MKNLFLFFILCCFLNADEEWQPLHAPLLTPEERFPVDLNESERRNLVESDERSRNVQRFNEREIPWISLFLVGVAIVFAFSGRKKKVTEVTKEEKIRTLQEEALAKLDTLQSSIGEISPEQFYVSLTQVFRSYIESYYGLPAEKMTTEEFFQKLKGNPIINEQSTTAIKNFLESADQVKFARTSASQGECQQALIYAVKFIRS